ncbi:cytochrome C assembly family protein [Craterilacuibacter sinensis]|nr:cytochrome c biogenesis protein CcsA [Craterilacuibacter sinensis]
MPGIDGLMTMSGFLFALSLCLLLAYFALSWHHIGHWKGRAVLPRAPRIEHGVLGLVLLAHAVLVLLPLLSGAHLDLGLGRALSTVVWLMLLIYWTSSFFYRVEGLQLLMLPLAVVALGVELLLPGHHLSYELANPLFALHLLVSMLAYSLFAIAALLAMLMLVLDRALHARRATTFTRQLPPLLSLEAMMFQVIAVGFALLTVSLLTGILFSEQMFATPFTLNHKIVFACAAWLVFGGLLLGRVRHGWRGRLAVRWTLSGFGLLLVGYIGSKIVLELLLGR